VTLHHHDPVKICNFTTKQRIFMQKKEFQKLNLSLLFLNLFFFISFIVVIWLLS